MGIDGWLNYAGLWVVNNLQMSSSHSFWSAFLLLRKKQQKTLNITLLHTLLIINMYEPESLSLSPCPLGMRGTKEGEDKDREWKRDRQRITEITGLVYMNALGLLWYNFYSNSPFTGPLMARHSTQTDERARVIVEMVKFFCETFV